MVDRFNLVALGITQERGIVLRMIIAQPRRTVVTSSGRKAGGMERVNLFNRGGPKAPVTARISRCVRGLIDAEIRMAVAILAVSFPKTDRIGSLVGDDRSESGHDTEVERFDTLHASNRYRDVIKELHHAYTGT